MEYVSVKGGVLVDYELELATVQKWIKATANLNSWRRAEAPPLLPRPVIVWESPHRSRKRNLHRYAYTQTVKYYGKLFINRLDECLRIQNTLTESLEDRLGRLEVADSNGTVIGFMKEAVVEFTQIEGLDIPFTFSYEVTYSRHRVDPLPPPKYVYTKVRIASDNENKGVNDNGSKTDS